MSAQFDVISPALQDTQGVRYDYRSIMHYDSAAFSRNGKNTIEATEEGYTTIIGAARDLSELDVIKVSVDGRLDCSRFIAHAAKFSA